MKISKSRLKQIIKEEMEEMREQDEGKAVARITRILAAGVFATVEEAKAVAVQIDKAARSGVGSEKDLVAFAVKNKGVGAMKLAGYLKGKAEAKAPAGGQQSSPEEQLAKWQKKCKGKEKSDICRTQIAKWTAKVAKSQTAGGTGMPGGN
jgi:hypothetical protein